MTDTRDLLPLLLRLWLRVPRSKVVRRQRQVMRWAALDALCRRRLPMRAMEHLLTVLENQEQHTLRLRRAAAIALTRICGRSAQRGSERLQQALARGFALALPRSLSMPQLVPGLLSEAECATTLEQAEEYATQHGWGSLHRQYPTVDLAVDKLPCGGAH